VSVRVCVGVFLDVVRGGCRVLHLLDADVRRADVERLRLLRRRAARLADRHELHPPAGVRLVLLQPHHLLLHEREVPPGLRRRVPLSPAAAGTSAGRRRRPRRATSPGTVNGDEVDADDDDERTTSDDNERRQRARRHRQPSTVDPTHHVQHLPAGLRHTRSHRGMLRFGG